MHDSGRFAALIRDDLTLDLSAPGAGRGALLRAIRDQLVGTGS
jgi:hypothetical protein